MKHILLLFLCAVLLGSCGTRNKNNTNDKTEIEPIEAVYSVDALMKDADGLVDKEVVVKGTVMHVCKQGGGRCFLMGSNEDSNIRIEAGEGIGAFDQSQMGADLTIKGILKEVKTEADAHNPASEHGESEAEHDESTENAHRIIQEANENVDAVYFMEGIRVIQVEV